MGRASEWLRSAAKPRTCRAAAAITQETSFFAVGSQEVLFSFEHPPHSLLVSRELDLFPALAPEIADLIDGDIGALSSSDQTFSYHADGVGPETAVMPPDRRTREQLPYVGDVTVICPEIHDPAISKCVAGREEDAVFVAELFRHRMIDLQTLVPRIATLGAEHRPELVAQWAQRRHAEAFSS
jgi:hypothetical protein